MPNNRPYKLKGVIPAQKLTLEEKQKRLRELQEFLRQFPGLAEEVMKEREQQQPEYFPAH